MKITNSLSMVVTAAVVCESGAGNAEREALSNNHRSLQQTACFTEADCDAAREELGYEKFFTGTFPSKGCFAKNGKAYFSEGDVSEMTRADLPGIQERIWCTGASFTDGRSSGRTPCLTEDECEAKSEELGFKNFYTNDSYPSKGCFFKNNKAFFGSGGSVADMSEPDLPGVQQRIWCDDAEGASLTDETTERYGQMPIVENESTESEGKTKELEQELANNNSASAVRMMTSATGLVAVLAASFFL